MMQHKRHHQTGSKNPEERFYKLDRQKKFMWINAIVFSFSMMKTLCRYN